MLMDAIMLKYWICNLRNCTVKTHQGVDGFLLQIVCLMEIWCFLSGLYVLTYRLWMVLCVYESLCIQCAVRMCTRVSERDFGCLRCSSQFISGDIWPNSWAHLDTHAKTHSHTQTVHTFCQQVFLLIFSSSFVYSYCTCKCICVYILYVSAHVLLCWPGLNPNWTEISDVTQHIHTCVCVRVCVFPRQEMWTMCMLRSTKVLKLRQACHSLRLMTVFPMGATQMNYGYKLN